MLRSKNTHALRLASLFMLAALHPDSAGAQPVIDNMDQAIGAVTILGTVGVDRIWAAQSFSTPHCRVMTSIDVLLGQRIGMPEIVAELRVGDSPSGPAIATFTLPEITTGAVELVSMVPQAPVRLAAAQLYWIVLASADPTPIADVSFGWAYAATNDATGEGTLQNYHYSFDAGMTWQNFGELRPYKVTIHATPRCVADFNCSGAAGVQDIFDFLAAWFAGEAQADINGQSGVSVQDVFDFLAAWFAGCP